MTTVEEKPKFQFKKVITGLDLINSLNILPLVGTETKEEKEKLREEADNQIRSIKTQVRLAAQMSQPKRSYKDIVMLPLREFNAIIRAFAEYTKESFLE